MGELCEPEKHERTLTKASALYRSIGWYHCPCLIRVEVCRTRRIDTRKCPTAVLLAVTLPAKRTPEGLGLFFYVRFWHRSGKMALVIQLAKDPQIMKNPPC